jgi:tellurite resistance protein TerC
VYPISRNYQGQSFFIVEGGKRMATPLLAVLVVVETTDIIFAVDSIPAIFGVTREPFIVFTSNAFAIMGLRALYFLLANMMNRFSYLQLGLSAILGFIGIKMLVHAGVPDWSPVLAGKHYDMPIAISLAFIVSTLTISVVASLRKERRGEGLDALPTPADDPLGSNDSGRVQDEGRPGDA